MIRQRLSPLTPIFDPPKRRGVTNTGTTPASDYPPEPVACFTYEETGVFTFTFDAGCSTYNTPATTTPAKITTTITTPAVTATTTLNAIFTDDFNRADEPLNTSTGWIGYATGGGSVQVVSNKAVSDASFRAGAGVEDLGSPGNLRIFTDVEVELDIDQMGAAAPSFVRLYCRAQATPNVNQGYAVALLKNNDIQILEDQAPIATVTSATHGYTLPFRIKSQAIGTTIKGFVWDGSAWDEVISVVDASHATGGIVLDIYGNPGAGADGTITDNILVRAL